MRPGRLLFVLVLLSIGRIGLAEEGDPLDETEVPLTPQRDLGEEIQQLQHNNQVYEQVIKNLILRIEQLEISEQGTPVEAGQPEKPLDPKTQARLEKESEENTKLIQTAFEQRLSKEGGMLLGKSRITYEPNISYAHSSYDKIVVDGFTVFPVLVVGDIVSEKVTREVITNNHGFRFGLGHDLQLDLSIPIGYETEEITRGDGFHESTRTEGLGDISLGISYQLVKSSTTWPDTVFAFNWKTDTGEDPYRLLSTDAPALGTGFNTYSLSLTSLVNADPAILFGGYSVNYTDSDTKLIGNIKPGISHGITLGMALALNFDTSLSFNFRFQHTNKTKISGQNIPGSDMNTATFGIGLSMAGGDSYAVDVDLGIGLTADSPDFQLTVSFPFNFY
jgi:hypothetical protein